MLKLDVDAIFGEVKKGEKQYQEDLHCKMALRILSEVDKGTMAHFCVEALVSDKTVYKWLKAHELFETCFAIGRMFSRRNWEKMGLEVKDEVTMPGMSNNKFEYWKMIGWSRFGIGKTSRIRLDLNPEDSPDKHYSQLIAQSKNGDFTAGEIKQLMEAINVGLSTHQVFKLQKEVDQLRADLAIMDRNTNGDNTIPTS